MTFCTSTTEFNSKIAMITEKPKKLIAYVLGTLSTTSVSTKTWLCSAEAACWDAGYARSLHRRGVAFVPVPRVENDATRPAERARCHSSVCFRGAKVRTETHAVVPVDSLHTSPSRRTSRCRRRRSLRTLCQGCWSSSATGSKELSTRHARKPPRGCGCWVRDCLSARRDLLTNARRVDPNTRKMTNTCETRCHSVVRRFGLGLVN